MKFDSVKKLKINPTFAAEAAGGIRVINVEDEPMQIKLITDQIIDANELKPVTNPIMFERGYVPTVDGLFSEYIFGTTSEEIMRTYAYIDLKRKFIHPYIYEVLKKLYRNVERICAGQSSWVVLSDGSLQEIKDMNDPKYDEDNTGLDWFIENYRKIRFEENDSLGRSERLKLINSLKHDEIFITKWIVIPLFYRDIDKSTGPGSRKIPDLNYDYNDLIKYTNSLNQETIGFYSNHALFNIQMALVKIRKFGQSLIEKKSGAFHQMVLGKSIDNGTRAVISVPSMNYYEKATDFPIDMLHTGIPLARCLIIGYPFMIKWVLEFFDRELGDKKTKTYYRKDKKTGEYKMEEVEIADQSSVFTEDYINKKMEDFINTYGSRFEPIKIKLADGTEGVMKFTGRGYSRNAENVKSATITNRPLTWTDVFYMAAVETLSDKHVYITRYPLVDYFGIFPSRCLPTSTVKTTPVIIDDRVYPHYPVIDVNMPFEKVSTQFIDTVTMSNLFLDAIGGDYDGDMVTVKMVYSIEANQEAEEIINSLKHYISIQGSIVRIVKNEAYLTFYNMTKP